MAFRVESDEAERLARRLAALTGETVSESVTRALRERMERLKPAIRPGPQTIAADISRVASEIRERFDLTPISKADWDALWGEDDLFPGDPANRTP